MEIVGKRAIFILVATLAILLLAGCSGESPGPDAVASTKPNLSAVKNPVELTFYLVSTSTKTDEELKVDYTEKIQRKYPHISLKFMQNQGTPRLIKW